jgi:glyoxalase/bleomycin resistance protein/dioxygenase superfamily protein
MAGPHIAHFDQLGYVVPDIDAAMQHWLEVLGVGPFFLMRDVAIEGAYEGDTPATVGMTVAFSYVGDVQIELIQPPGDTPSPYRTFAQSHGGDGLHHICRFTDHYHDDLAAIRAAQAPMRIYEATAGPMHLAYIEGNRPGGAVLELLNAPFMWDTFAQMAEAVRGWDGSDPIRPMAPPDI